MIAALQRQADSFLGRIVRGSDVRLVRLERLEGDRHILLLPDLMLSLRCCCMCSGSRRAIENACDSFRDVTQHMSILSIDPSLESLNSRDHQRRRSQITDREIGHCQFAEPA